MRQEKILIADDDRDLLEGLSFLFRAEGYHVISAMDGISALNLAQTQNPDLIILDLSLPWMDGYKVIEGLISPLATSDISIIVLTGRNAYINQDRAIKAGAEAFFHKAAQQSGRGVQIIGRYGQPPDHPINIYHPEGEYLKSLLLRII